MIAISSSTTGGQTIGNGTTYNTWGAYETIIFTYDGTYWVHQPSGLLGYKTYKEKAPLASPALTGTPTTPTPTASSTATMIANKAYVDSAIATAQTGAATFQGTATTSVPSTASIYSAGYYWLVGSTGTYINNSVYCQPGDMIFAVESRTAANTGSTADFTVIQQNLSPMDQSDINAATPLT